MCAMRKHHYILSIIFYLLTIKVSCQNNNIGIPFIKNYTKKAYQAGTQNWDIVQGKNGLVYFANNEGLLQFDSKNWRCTPLNNNTVVRSLAVDTSGIIYAGGQNEWGYYEPNTIGSWSFHSLKHLIPKADREFEDVWEIIINEQGIYFRASGKLYYYHDGEIDVYQSKGLINFIGSFGNKVFVHDIDNGLFYFENEHLTFINGSHILKDLIVTATNKLADDKWMITTLDGLIYTFNGQQFERWYTDVDAFLVSSKIYAAAVFPDGQIALGTSFNGMLMLDSNGKIVQHLNKENGLLNNSVLSMFIDQSHHLWLGLDNGIDYVLSNSPFSRFYPDGKSQGTAYCAQLYQENIYFGTSNGLYRTEWKDYYSPFQSNHFELVRNTKGIVWGLDLADDKLFMSHHKGGFLIDDKKAVALNTDKGYWLFEPWKQDTNVLIAGTYNGLFVFEKKAEQWHFRNKLSGFQESSRFLEQDNYGNLWIAHPYKGIYKLTPDENWTKVGVQKYGTKEGLPSDLRNQLFKINEELVFCGERGVWLYSNEYDRFEAYTSFNDIFGKDTRIINLFEATNGHIWYVTENDIGLLEIQDKSIRKEIKKHSFPFLKDRLVGGFEFIYPLDDKSAFIGTEEGFIYYDINKKIYSDTSFHVLLNEIRSTNTADSLIFSGIFSLKKEPVQEASFPYKMNAFLFSFSATDFVSPEATEFQYYLKGMENEWSDWTTMTNKEYTNLVPGEYTFYLKAKNAHGQETQNLKYHFNISPPWYATALAKFIYFLLGISAILGTFWFFFYKYNTQKKKVALSEIEIGQLKNERLELEIAHKNRVLVTNTVHLQHKNEILDKLKVELDKIRKQANRQEVKHTLSKAIKLIEIEENSEIGWEQFTAHFNDIHPGFFDKLRQEFPQLSSKDLKLCAYIRMHLSTNDIASLMNNTIRGVEGGRYRLRKKMGLDTEVNLSDFILQF